MNTPSSKNQSVQVVIALATRALDAPFTYAIPDDMSPVVGDVAIVELGNQKVLGFVVGLDPDVDPTVELKPVLALISGPFFSATSFALADWIARYYAAPLSESLKLFLPKGLADRLKKALASYKNAGEVKMPGRRPKKSADAESSYYDNHLKPAKLTKGQKTALGAVLTPKDARPIVLEGVTGSGKTEVYLRAIEGVRQEGKSAILLVPEISLTPQTVGRIRARFGDDVAVLHSGMTDGERYTQWEKVQTGECGVVVGARSALFAPVHDLGLVIIDEEHDGSYKQNNSPRYHAREVAEKLCTLNGAKLVMGSATPSLEALHAAEKGVYQLVKLPDRVNNKPLPEVTIVDLTKEFSDGHRSMFSRELLKALQQVEKRQEKAILLLNRRGFANFLLCRECGYVPGCEHCSTSLTYHAPQNHLRCHQCNTIKSVPVECPQCESPYLRQFGGGVQRVEQEFREHFPDWQLIRMDADTTAARGAHAEILDQFGNSRTGVLLGTQMVAKGHDFPDVTLVGVLNADVTLNLPDFRANERGYQLLEQVAGRAGRADLEGRVIIQTYNPDNVACRAVAAHDSEILISDERIVRKAFGYPPFASLCNIVISSTDESQVKKYSERLRGALRESDDLKRMKATLMGPAPCMLSKKSGSFRYHIMIKAGAGQSIGPAVQESLKSLSKSSGIKIAVDVNPTDTF